jgi:hypothetical protein
LTKAEASQDSSIVTSVVSSKIKAVVDLTVTAGSTTVDFNFDDAVKLTNGITKPAVFTLQTKSNKAYFVTVQAADANFSGGESTDPLSVATLGVSIGASTTYTSLSDAPQAIIGASDSKINRGTNSYVVNYKMNPGFNAAPAEDYTTTLTYTITAP